MDDGTDRQMELMFSFYEHLHRKAPGSERSTRRALSLLGELPPDAEIVDFGCGSGAASLVLAEAGAKVTAVDIYQAFLDRLDALAAEAGLSGRIRTVRADMADPPFSDGSFDVVWSEGAIYLVGFEAGLERWRRLLRPGGRLAVTEAVWLCEDPSAEAAAFWEAGYPAITSIEENLKMLRSAGFEPVDHFVLPKEDWSDYYEPLQKQLGLFRKEHSQNQDARSFVDELQREVDVWRDWGDSFGYVFCLARHCM
jgi:SAM-dependent methyltransferase